MNKTSISFRPYLFCFSAHRRIKDYADFMKFVKLIYGFRKNGIIFVH